MHALSSLGGEQRGGCTHRTAEWQVQGVDDEDGAGFEVVLGGDSDLEAVCQDGLTSNGPQYQRSYAGYCPGQPWCCRR